MTIVIQPVKLHIVGKVGIDQIPSHGIPCRHLRPNRSGMQALDWRVAQLLLVKSLVGSNAVRVEIARWRDPPGESPDRRSQSVHGLYCEYSVAAYWGFHRYETAAKAPGCWLFASSAWHWRRNSSWARTTLARQGTEAALRTVLTGKNRRS